MVIEEQLAQPYHSVPDGSKGGASLATEPPAQPQPAKAPKPRRSALRVIALAVVLIVIFVVVASATALVVMARRGTMTLPWQAHPAPTVSPEPGGAGERHRVPPKGSLGHGDEQPQGSGGSGNQTGLFESALGYRARVPPGWQVVQRAQPGGGDSAFDSFTNGRAGEDYASIQVLALEAAGIDAFQVASQVATKASTQQGYSIMVQPQRGKFATLDSASFRAYAVQNGFPLIVEVFVVAGPDGKFLQIQFASSLEGFARNSGAISTFEQQFELRSD